MNRRSAVQIIKGAFSTISVKQWEAGDAALAIVPMGNDHGRNGADAAVAELADEAGVSASALNEYRSVAYAWPETTRVASASWTLHREVRGRADRAEYLVGFIRDCKTKGIKPSYRAFQTHQGKPATPEFSKNKAETAVREAMAMLPRDKRAEIVQEEIERDEEVAISARRTLGKQVRERLIESGIDPDMPPEPFEQELDMEARRIRDGMDHMAGRVRALARRAEADQWRRLEPVIEPALSRLVQAFAGTPASPEGINQ